MSTLLQRATNIAEQASQLAEKLSAKSSITSDSTVMKSPAGQVSTSELKRSALKLADESEAFAEKLKSI